MSIVSLKYTKSELIIGLFFDDSASLVSEKGNVKLLTKGDNNAVDDRGLYARGQLWVSRDEVIGRARGYVLFS